MMWQYNLDDRVVYVSDDGGSTWRPIEGSIILGKRPI